MKVLIDDRLNEIGKSRYWLSQQTEITYPSIKHICDNNVESMRFDTIDKICKILECNIEQILKNG